MSNIDDLKCTNLNGDKSHKKLWQNFEHLRKKCSHLGTTTCKEIKPVGR